MQHNPYPPPSSVAEGLLSTRHKHRCWRLAVSPIAFSPGHGFFVLGYPLSHPDGPLSAEQESVLNSTAAAMLSMVESQGHTVRFDPSTVYDFNFILNGAFIEVRVFSFEGGPDDNDTTH